MIDKEMQMALEADGEKLRALTGEDHGPHFLPENCPHCEYDRQFPETAGGGWMYLGNNGPIVSCPMCNPDGSHERA